MRKNQPNLTHVQIVNELHVALTSLLVTTILVINSPSLPQAS